MKQTVRRTILPVALAALAVSLLIAPVSRAASHRVVAQLGEPFLINGQRYPAGELAVRHLGSYNPSSALVQIWVDDECVGIMLATGAASGAENGESSLVFERNHRGDLVLVGFAYRGQVQQEFYRYRADETQHWVSPARRASRGALIAAR